MGIGQAISRDTLDDVCGRGASTTQDVTLGNLVIGAGAAGVDYTLTFDGEDNDGVLTWDEGNAIFAFGGDVSLNNIIGTSPNTDIFNDTVDGSDTNRSRIGGGGDVLASRGAFLSVAGNEHATEPGFARLAAGNVAGAKLRLETGGVSRLVIDANGYIETPLTIQESGTRDVLKCSRDTDAGDSTNTVAILIGNSGNDQGDVSCRYTNAAANGGPTADWTFQPRNNADDGQAVCARIIFSKNAGNNVGNIQLQASNAAGAFKAAAIIDGDDVGWNPVDDDTVNLGRTAKRWKTGWFHDVTVTDTLTIENDLLKALGGVRTKCADDNVSDPPTDAELDAAFGTPANLGTGFIGVLDDNSDETDTYICYTTDNSWFYVKGTKAV